MNAIHLALNRYKHLSFIDNTLRAISILHESTSTSWAIFFQWDFHVFVRSLLLTIGLKFAVVIYLEYHDNCTCRIYGLHRVSYSLVSFANDYRNKRTTQNMNMVFDKDKLRAKKSNERTKLQKNIWEIPSVFLSAWLTKSKFKQRQWNVVCCILAKVSFQVTSRNTSSKCFDSMASRMIWENCIISNIEKNYFKGSIKTGVTVSGKLCSPFFRHNFDESTAYVLLSLSMTKILIESSLSIIGSLIFEGFTFRSINVLQFEMQWIQWNWLMISNLCFRVSWPMTNPNYWKYRSFFWWNL